MAFLTSSPGMLPVPHIEEEGELRRQVLFLSKPHSLYKTLSNDVLSLTKSNNQAVPMKIDEKIAIRGKCDLLCVFQSTVFLQSATSRSL